MVLPAQRYHHALAFHVEQCMVRTGPAGISRAQLSSTAKLAIVQWSPDLRGHRRWSLRLARCWMMRRLTQHMPRISEFHPLDARSTCDCHEIGLASGEFLFTTSLRLAKNTSPLSRSIATAAV